MTRLVAVLFAASFLAIPAQAGQVRHPVLIAPQPTQVATAGKTKPKVTISPIVITKKIDVATPKL